MALGVRMTVRRKLAGLTMKLIGDVPLWITAIVVFFRGAGAEGDLVDA